MSSLNVQQNELKINLPVSLFHDALPDYFLRGMLLIAHIGCLPSISTRAGLVGHLRLSSFFRRITARKGSVTASWHTTNM
jgi:hypothetical protein